MSPFLTTLIIANCSNLTNLSLVTLGKLKYLHRLDISCCKRITDAGIEFFAVGSKTKSLRSLNISEADLLTDKSFETIGKYFGATLHCLKASGLPQITDNGVEKLTRSVVCLKTLDLTFCSQLTDRSSIFLATCQLQVTHSRSFH